MLALEIGRIQGKGKPVLSLKKMEESMGSWAIVQWTVPRLGIAYAWALLPFLYTRSKNRSDSLHEVPSLPFQDL